MSWLANNFCRARSGMAFADSIRTYVTFVLTRREGEPTVIGQATMIRVVNPAGDMIPLRIDGPQI
jgi:hypothetical protein